MPRRDPTASAAIGNVTRDEREERLRQQRASVSRFIARELPAKMTPPDDGKRLAAAVERL